MRNSQFRPRGTSPSDIQEKEVSVDDIVRYLSGLARLHSQEKTGNLVLSRGLRHLARALRPYADSPISELSSALGQEAGSSRASTASRKHQATLPTDLESLCQEDVEKILEDKSYTKQQVAELGARRFGMSRSELARIRKVDALQSVRAALEHELSLDVISEEARKGGMARAI